MKKIVSCILAALLLLAMFAGCSSDPNNKDALRIYSTVDGEKADLLRTIKWEQEDAMKTAKKVIDQSASGKTKKIESSPDYIFEVLNTDGKGDNTDVWVWFKEDKVYNQIIDGFQDGENSDQRECDITIHEFNELIK